MMAMPSHWDIRELELFILKEGQNGCLRKNLTRYPKLLLKQKLYPKNVTPAPA